MFVNHIRRMLSEAGIYAIRCWECLRLSLIHIWLQKTLQKAVALLPAVTVDENVRCIAAKLAGRIAGWIALRKKANADKKLAIFLNLSLIHIFTFGGKVRSSRCESAACLFCVFCRQWSLSSVVFYCKIYSLRKHSQHRMAYMPASESMRRMWLTNKCVSTDADRKGMNHESKNL